MNNRSQYFGIDIAKAISIFGVVYIHAGFLEDQVSSYAFRFGVPIFITISFFLSEKTLIDKNSKFNTYVFLKKRLTRIFSPLVFWTVFYAFTDFYLGIKTSIEISPVFGWTGQYFFIVLLQLTLIYPLLRKLSINLRHLIIIIGTTVSLVYFPISYLRQLDYLLIPRGEASFIFWLNYMAFGIFAARHYEQIKGWLKKKNLKNRRIPLILACSALLIGEQISLNYFRSDTLALKPYTYSRISILVASTLIFLICIDFDRNANINKFFVNKINYLSRWSLGIFCLNPFIIDVFEIFIKTSELDQANTFILISLRLILSAAICMIAISISRLMYALGLKILVQ